MKVAMKTLIYGVVILLLALIVSFVALLFFLLREYQEMDSKFVESSYVHKPFHKFSLPTRNNTFEQLFFVERRGEVIIRLWAHAIIGNVKLRVVDANGTERLSRSGIKTNSRR